MRITAEAPLSAASGLFALVSDMAAERDRTRLAEKCLAAACRIAGAGAGVLYALDRSGEHLVPVAARPRAMITACSNPLALYPDREPNMTDPRAWCAFTGRAAVIENLAIVHGFDTHGIMARDHAVGRVSRSLIACPLRNNEERTVGVLELCDVGTEEGICLTGAALAEVVPTLQAFAYQAAITIATNQLVARNAELLQELDGINRDLSKENIRLRKDAVVAASTAGGVVSQSPAMQRVLDLVGKVAESTVPVLILGETGTGKEVIARLLHAMSPRRSGPFVAQNCAALPAHLLESELFGYRKGAFTGATQDKKGLFESAAGGTLFLDEIADMPLELQTKLLRVLQDGEVRPLGALEAKTLDVRILAATNAHLRARIATGSFREDLFYRISVFPIFLPPLRERLADILPLAAHFVAAMPDARVKDIRGFTPAAARALTAYPFPGNVRELKNIVERAVILCPPHHPIDAGELPTEVGRVSAADATDAPRARSGASDGLRERLRLHEAAAILAALEAAGGNRTRAAAALGVSRRALHEKIARYKLGHREQRGKAEPCPAP